MNQPAYIHRDAATQSAAAIASAKGQRAALLGLVVNLGLAIIKGAAGVMGNSYALIADAAESLTDVGSSTIVWLGLKFASRPPDENHPYGHGKAEPLAAGLVCMFLFAAALGIAVQSVREILLPHHTPAPFTLVVLVLVVAIKEALFRFVLSVGSELSSSAVQSDAWHHRSDAITSGAAFVGILIALVGGPGYESADDWAALCASAIIAYNGCRLLQKAINELTDAAPDPQIEETIREIAIKVAGVKSLEKCFVRKMGFDYYVDLHVMVEGDETVRRGHAIAHDVQDAIKAALPQVSQVLIHVEPY